MKKILIIFILLSNAGISQSRLNPLVQDSLMKIWNDPEQIDTNRFNAMRFISWNGYISSNPDSAFYYAGLLYNLAKEKDNAKYIGIALHTQGAACAANGNYELAIKKYKRSLFYYKKSDYHKGAAGIYGNLGNIYNYQGNYELAIKNYTKGLQAYEKINYQLGIAITTNNIGLIYSNQNDHQKAIDYFKQSMDIYQILKDTSDYATALINTGIVYNHKNELDKALNFYAEALKLMEKINYSRGIALALNNLGLVNKQIGDQANDAGDKILAKAKYDEALIHLERCLKIKEEIKDKRGTALTLINIASTYSSLKQFNKALEYGKRGLELAEKTGAALETETGAKTLWSINKKMNRFKESLEMYELYISTRDSIESEENRKEVIRQEYKYQYEKQAAADSIKTAEEKKVKNAQIAQQDAEIKAKNNQQYMLFGGLGLVLIFAAFMYNRFKITQKQKGIIEEQKHIVEEKNKEITDSINYAKRIQTAILPPDKIVKQHLPDSFILYKPKDIVAGDFYWLESFAFQASDSEGNNSKPETLNPKPQTPNSKPETPNPKQVLFAACDCTGHGVPGAMVSVVCNNSLNRAVREFGLTDPGKILDKTRELVIQEFEKSEEEVKDGMDVALCALEIEDSRFKIKDSIPKAFGIKIQYSGANNPLWLIRSCPPPEGVAKPGEENEYTLIEYKPNKQPIGKYADPKPFTTHEIELQKGDTIYIFTDGFQDQFGGDKGKKLKAKPFKDLLLSVQDKSMEEQRKIIDEAFEKWKGNLEQNDDVCIIGVRV